MRENTRIMSVRQKNFTPVSFTDTVGENSTVKPLLKDTSENYELYTGHFVRSPRCPQ